MVKGITTTSWSLQYGESYKKVSQFSFDNKYQLIKKVWYLVFFYVHGNLLEQILFFVVFVDKNHHKKRNGNHEIKHHKNEF